MRTVEDINKELRELEEELCTAKAAEAEAKYAVARTANKLISAKVKQAEALLRECEKLAVAAGLSFTFDLREYGNGYEFSDGGWRSSSDRC